MVLKDRKRQAVGSYKSKLSGNSDGSSMVASIKIKGTQESYVIYNSPMFWTSPPGSLHS